MASTIAAVTTGGGGVITTADSSGNLSLLSGATTVVAVTSTGVAVTGTLAVSGTSSFTGAVTLTGGLNTPLAVLQGGTGVTTSTGTGAGVHSVGPSISSAVMTTMASSVITSGTAVATTSGTSIDFTSIPSWVKRITVMVSNVSTNGASNLLVQMGTSGGIQATGYLSTAATISNALVDTTAGFIITYQNNAAWLSKGAIVFNITGADVWLGTGITTQTAATASFNSGTKTLGGTLDRVRLTTVNGTDTFDAGSVNILYE